jgi:peptidoglycan/LPS O-acetylase OafA/YrhL
LNFRSDIQVLRGLAVLLVILYHLKVSFLSLGFLGVDIFFVISGFLMAVLYNSGQKVVFYKRRIYRLLPSYFVVLFLTFAVSLVIVKPSEFEVIIDNAYFSSAIILNISSVFTNSYFQNNIFNPFLHFWSLAVEFQFYLLVPFLMFTKTIKGGLLACFIVSLFFCLFFILRQPTFSFFLTPFRVWEFIFGMVTAIYFTNKGNVRYQNFGYVGLFALLLIVFLSFLSFLGVDGNSKNLVFGHPGLAAFVTCLLTALILLFGLPDKFTFSFFGKILQKTGKYSYSLYLVHYPIILLYNYSPFYGVGDHQNNILDIVIILFLMLSLSYILYKKVETYRFMNLKKLTTIVLLTPLIVTFIDFQKTNLWNVIFSKSEFNIYSSLNDRSGFRCGKYYRYLNRNDLSCKLGNVDIKNELGRVLLVGNSHADSIKQEFTKVAATFDITVYFLVKNNPLMEGGLKVKNLIDEAKRLKINKVYLHFSPNVLSVETLDRLELLSSKSNIDVSFLLPVPIYKESIPVALLHEYNSNIQKPTKKSQKLIENDPLKLLEKNNLGFTLQDPKHYFCKDLCIVSSSDWKPYYFDDGHLTLTGSELLAPLFEEYFTTNFNGEKN